MHPLLSTTLSRIAAADFIGLDEATARALVHLPAEALPDLMALARLAASRAPLKGGFFTCGIVSAKTGKCSEDCAFCAQSAHYATGAQSHPLLSYDALAARADELSKNGVNRFGIVTSGHSLSPRERDSLYEVVSHLKTAFPDLLLCASLGRASEAQAVELMQAGFSRYHHNVETSASHYPAICTTHDYAERLGTVRAVKKAGMEICSGGIFGLGETWMQRVEMALTLRDEGVDAVPVNFLNAIPGTPMEKQQKLTPAEALRVIALLRLILPHRDILVCGGREHVLGAWQPWLIAAGATGLMVGNYLTTKGSDFAADREMFRSLGIAAMEQPE